MVIFYSDGGGKVSGESKCSYNCSNGRIFDVNIQSWVPCPECSQKKSEEFSKNSEEITEKLGIDGSALSGVLVPEAVIPLNERGYVEDKSFDDLSDKLNEIYSRLIQGKTIKQSYCFGIGVKGKVKELVFPLQKAAYTSGLNVVKFISAIGLSQMLLKQSLPENLFVGDLCIILINEGCSKADVSACKGVMQERAVNELGTVFVTTWSVEACSNLLGYSDNEDCYLAKPVFIKYKYSEKHSNYINDLFGVENSLPDLGL